MRVSCRSEGAAASSGFPTPHFAEEVFKHLKARAEEQDKGINRAGPVKRTGQGGRDGFGAPLRGNWSGVARQAQHESGPSSGVAIPPSLLTQLLLPSLRGTRARRPRVR